MTILSSKIIMICEATEIHGARTTCCLLGPEVNFKSMVILTLTARIFRKVETLTVVQVTTTTRSNRDPMRLTIRIGDGHLLHYIGLASETTTTTIEDDHPIHTIGTVSQRGHLVHAIDLAIEVATSPIEDNHLLGFGTLWKIGICIGGGGQFPQVGLGAETRIAEEMMNTTRTLVEAEFMNMNHNVKIVSGGDALRGSVTEV